MPDLDPTFVSGSPSLRQRLPLYPSQVVVAMAMVSVGPLLDPIMKGLGIPLSSGGLISAALYLGNVSGIFVLNMLMARIRSKVTLTTGIFVQGVGLVLAGAASRNLWSLCLAYVLVGFGGALLNTTCWMWISTHVKENVASAALTMILFFGFCMVAAPVIIGVALDHGAYWRWILVGEGCISLTLGLIYVWLPLLNIPGRQNVRPRHIKEVAATDKRLLIGMMAAGLLYTGSEMTLNVWLPKFQIDVFGSADTWASFSVTLFWIGLVAGRWIMRPFSRRHRPSRLLLFCAVTMAVFTASLAVAPNQITALVLAVFAGLGASASYGLIGSYAGAFPGWQAGVASSLFILAGGVGSISFPYIMGPLASSAGFRPALAVLAIPVLVLAGVSFLLRPRAQTQPSAGSPPH
jgi:FHS family glucose/mannose:H+ symporter-like MFS transporter